MAIQVTGLFQNPANEQIFKDPILLLVPHLVAWGEIILDINILNASEEVLGAFPFSIDKDSLSYENINTSDCYAGLLKSIQNKLIEYLPTTNDVNLEATYDVYVKIIP